jgi:signal transduction histidine kinase
MQKGRSNRSFFWQGLLIALPVAVLAAMGAWSLRQDWSATRHDAEDQGRMVAEELLTKTWDEITSTNPAEGLRALSFTTDDEGNLLDPPPRVELSVPNSQDSTNLNEEQARLRAEAHRLEAAAAEATGARHLSPAILGRSSVGAVNESERNQAETWWRAWQKDELRRGLFSAVLTSVPAAFRFRLQTATNANSESIASSPTMFWVHLAERFPRFGGNDALSETAQATNSWLVVRSAASGARRLFTCYHEATLRSRVAELVKSSRATPSYCGVQVEVAGRQLALPHTLRLWSETEYFGRRGGGLKKEFSQETASTILASTARNEGTEALIKTTVYLTSPSVLFKHQRARVFWLASLIAVAALAALAGLFAAHRAFVVQLRLSEMKSDFVASVSHELRAPIASVRLMAESLEAGRIPGVEKQREYFRFIVQECRRLSALVENVLDFSRIEQGREEYEFEPTDLAALTRQTVKLMEPNAAERDITLALSVPELAASRDNAHSQGLLAVVDGKAIQQALVNLVDNAIKHSPKGQTVTVGLEMLAGAPAASADPVRASPSEDGALDAEPVENVGQRPATEPRESVLLWVEDHGEGIPAEEREKIFERFYRRGSELRRETQGVGIGLGIVKHITESHGGKVRLRSEVGSGSRFTIELPLAPQNVRKERRAQRNTIWNES